MAWGSWREGCRNEKPFIYCMTSAYPIPSLLLMRPSQLQVWRRPPYLHRPPHRHTSNSQSRDRILPSLWCRACAPRARVESAWKLGDEADGDGYDSHTPCEKQVRDACLRWCGLLAAVNFCLMKGKMVGSSPSMICAYQKFTSSFGKIVANDLQYLSYLSSMFSLQIQQRRLFSQIYVRIIDCSS